MSRINISVSDELKAKMDQPKFKNINWSEVASKAFEKEMRMKKYCFHVRLIGYGETIEQAYHAINAALADNNLPKYDTVLCLEDEESDDEHSNL